jgi:hypothetical protein
MRYYKIIVGFAWSSGQQYQPSRMPSDASPTTTILVDEYEPAGRYEGLKVQSRPEAAAISGLASEIPCEGHHLEKPMTILRHLDRLAI